MQQYKFYNGLFGISFQSDSDISFFRFEIDLLYSQLNIEEKNVVDKLVESFGMEFDSNTTFRIEWKYQPRIVRF